MQRAFSADAGVIRVLLVDDDQVLVRSLHRVLSRQGFEVEVATDGRTALAHLQANDYDVMLLDLRMGSMDGMEIYALTPPERLPATIVHSAHVDLKTAVSATRAGVHDVMQKPVPEEHLASRIRELAAERRAALQSQQAAASPNVDISGLERLVGGSADAGELREQIRRVAQFRNVPVLIQGPTGTGKELVAQAIHALTCPTEPFVSLNCAAIPEQLFESELFGHDAGAFTSARAPRVGLFEEAGQGTLFLDEIGEMPLALQAKLLRVLETREFRRVGGTRSRAFSARVVSATNRTLGSAASGSLRPDLFFRLAGYAIRTPSLVDRLDDLPALVQHFINDFGVRHGIMGLTLTEEAMQGLKAHSWPGNIRELRAVVENAAIITRGGAIGRSHIQRALHARATQHPRASGPGRAAPPPRSHVEARPIEPAARPARDEDEAPTQISRAMPVAPPAEPASGRVGRRSPSLPDLQRDMILRAFEESEQNLSKAAQDLGIPRSTLRGRLRRYGVR